MDTLTELNNKELLQINGGTFRPCYYADAIKLGWAFGKWLVEQTQ